MVPASEPTSPPLVRQCLGDAFVDGFPSGLMVVDRDFRIQRVNASHAAFLKRTPESMVGQRCFQLIHGRDARCEDCPCAQAFLTGYPATTTHGGRDGDGAPTMAELVALPIRDASGQVVLALEMARDVSERARHLAQLEASREELRRHTEDLEVLNSMMARASRSVVLPDVLDGLVSSALRLVGGKARGGIFLLDDTRRRLTLTTQRGFDDAFVAREQSVRLGECLCGAAALTGEVLVVPAGQEDARHSRPCAQPGEAHVIIPLMAHEQVLGVLFLYLPVGQQLAPRHQRLFGMLGRQAGIAIENARLYGHTDAALQHKVTELTQALAAVEQERARAQASERSKDEFLAMVSHDLRSPLAVIHSEASETNRQCQDPECRESRELTRHSARRMTAMLGDLVDSARLEAGSLDLQHAPLDLPQMVRELLERGFSASERPRLRCAVPEGPIQVHGDRAWLERALVNVIGNALKFAPPTSPVTVRLFEDGAHASVVVEDQGPGIPPDELPRLFQRFSRASNTRRVHGAGLGLYISRLVVEAHGGQLAAHSVLGQGVTITLALPSTSPVRARA